MIARALAGVVFAFAACTGDIGDRAGAPNAPGLGGPGAYYGGSGAAAGPGAGPSGPGQQAPGGSAAELPAPTTRAARLTHAQWENTVRDLFYLAGDTAFSSLLRSDPVQSGFLFENNATTLEVDESLFSGYQRAAAEVASYVTSDASRLARVASADAGDPAARARAFVEQLGLRAHRRPLEPIETDEYLALFALGPTLYDGVAAFEAGARVTIEAMLQSPHFVYRIEDGEGPRGDVIPLDDYEIASRLAYTLWNTMPDAELFDAAAASALAEPVELDRQVRRLLGDPRAQSVALSFHAQLFEAERFGDVRPSSAFYPDAPAELGALARTEHEMFVRDLVFGVNGSYTDMLTSTQTFANDALADIYGLGGGFGDVFVKTALPAAQRRGILTQVGFLAANATSANPDPIHRGVFIARRIACMQVSAPPANVPPLPPPEGRTNRETVAEHTENPDTICANCHATIINPLGFPFEGYDAVGAFRIQDNGQPVDTRAEAPIGSGRVQVADAVELAEALARSEDVHACYAKHWLQFANARPDAAQDQALIARLSAASLAGGLPIAELIVQLVTSPAFLSRSTEELP